MSIVLAFSGGLDTSFCVPYLAETYGEPVYTVTVNTGGLTAGEAAALEAKALELGAAKHLTLDARRDLYDDLLSYLIKGNVLRGGVYPLCVGPERVVQARHVVEAARQLGARAVAHGSTGAGNDQVRFDVALRILGGDLEILTPIRDLGLSRPETAAYLTERGFHASAEKATYSINKGLWGTTIGGRETLTTHDPLPEAAYPDTVAPAEAPDAPLDLTIAFEKGLPVALDGDTLDPVTLIETLNDLGARHGVGRGIHVGDTILGIKGRVAFEAPAPLILITAHRELEKIVLTQWQQFQKNHLADFYGMMLHGAQYFDPVMRDIEAFLDASQEVVTGTVRVRLHKGQVSVLGCDSPHSMFDAGVATYGETNQLWDARDARGFTRIYGLQAYLAHRARQGAVSTPTQKDT
ncbi:MAG: argininosuccinate synthase [Rhodothermaceae bacterium]|nr:MAG: argininosuccinate synthase [Rhodothermaceae bacterium]